MSNKKKSLLVIVSGVLVLALGAGMVALISTTAASAQTTPLQRMEVRFSNLTHNQWRDGKYGFHRGPDLPGGGGENDTYLAESLGISVEELQAAREKAFAAAMQAAIENGEMTEEQASLMLARQALRSYIDQEALTAKALGLTVEELQAAREEGKSPRDLMDELGISNEDFQATMQAAYEAAVQEAVEDGVITQEQADLVLDSEASFAPGGPGGSIEKGGPGDMKERGDAVGFPGRGENMDTYLAEALGISVEELQAARQEAKSAAIQAAVDSGELTEDQASLMQARQALQGYIDQEALTAKALGITVEELQAAREEGKSPHDLMDELGISAEDFQAAMQAAYEAAVQQAVEDGVITQAQADLILNSDMGFGQGGPGGFPGAGGPGQPGGPGRPGGPGQNPPDGTNGFPGGPNLPTPEGDG